MLLRTAILGCLTVASTAFVAPLELLQRTRPMVARQPAVAPCMAATPPALVARRDALASAAALALLGIAPLPAMASGGATAGKYTTQPIAKRRYFGRVKQGVFEFLQMEAPIFKGDLKNEDISNFFADSIVVARKKTKTNCLAPGTSACEISEKSTSRWEDMKLSCFLLGNAFRVDSGKPPEKVKQVKEAKVFFAEVDKMRRAADAGNNKAAAVSYAAAKEALEIFLNDVELPPTSFPDYKQTADVSVPSLCQGSFCI